MTTKTLIGALIAGVCFWLLGFLMYGVLLSDIIGQYNTVGRPSGDELMVHLVLGNLVFGLLLAWLWSKMGVTSFSRGVSYGAFIGLLSALGSNLIMHGTTTIWNSPTGMIYDILALTVIWGVTGGVAGWWMGRK